MQKSVERCEGYSEIHWTNGQHSDQRERGAIIEEKMIENVLELVKLTENLNSSQARQKKALWPPCYGFLEPELLRDRGTSRAGTRRLQAQQQQSETPVSQERNSLQC